MLATAWMELEILFTQGDEIKLICQPRLSVQVHGSELSVAFLKHEPQMENSSCVELVALI